MVGQRLCSSELEIVQALLAGCFASSWRGIGKTQGLLIAVHLKHGGDAVIAVLNGNHVSLVRERYREMFPRDMQPKVVIATRGNLEGLSKPTYADEFCLMKPEAQDLLYALGERFCGATG